MISIKLSKMFYNHSESLFAIWFYSQGHLKLHGDDHR